DARQLGGFVLVNRGLLMRDKFEDRKEVFERLFIAIDDLIPHVPDNTGAAPRDIHLENARVFETKIESHHIVFRRLARGRLHCALVGTESRSEQEAAASPRRKKCRKTQNAHNGPPLLRSRASQAP